MWRYVRYAAIAAIVASFAISRSRRNTTGEDRAEVPIVNRALADFITAAHTAEDEEQPDYKRAVEHLRADRDGVIRAAESLLLLRPAADAGLRHTVVMGLSAMREPSALDLLAVVALNPQPLPPKEGSREWFAADHHGGDAVGGLMVALEALEGVEALAQADHAAALDVLARAAASSFNPIRAAALTALRSHPEGREHFRRAEAALPSELRHLAEVRRMRASEVQQIRDARTHLARPEAHVAGAPGLGRGAPEPRPAPRNVPRVHGGN